MPTDVQNRMAVVLSDRQYEYLKSLARLWGITSQDALRKLVADDIERRQRKQQRLNALMGKEEDRSE